MGETTHRISYRQWGVVGAVAVVTIVLQLVIGDLPIEILSFPLNILLMALWVVGLLSLYKRRDRSSLAQFMLQPKATWLSLALMAIIGVILGVQVEPMTESWPVVAAILFILSHLTMVIMRGWRTSGGIRWRFSILHFGLWLALVAGFFGAPDRNQLRVLVVEELPTDTAYDMSGQMSRLDYPITLLDFYADYYDNGVPSTYRASISIEEEQHTLEVNKPLDRTWSETIYLISHGIDTSSNKQYCILEVVNEPWQWLSTTGIVMLIVGAILLFVGGPRQDAKNRS